MTDTIHVAREELVRMAPPPPRPRPAPQPSRPLFALRELLPAGLLARTRDIVAANFGELLDRAEDPAKMIRMIILEMEETLVEVRVSAARTIADQQEMRRQVGKLERVRDGWAEKAELALSKGREDLSRAALVEKQKYADLADGLAAEIAMHDEALRASEADIARLQGRLREARMRQSAIRARLDSANQRARMREAYAGPRTEEAFTRFEVLERRADLAEGHADSLLPPKSLEDEIAELRNEEKVNAELEAMKTRLAAAKDA
ncbi:MAG: phage shock protein [Sphingomonadales bacterium]|jgi:phage shock protein A|nr:phage shock protein [Sphingomonadales bacterium]